MKTNLSIKIGDKVNPINKSTRCFLEDSAVWKTCQSQNQNYMYVKDITFDLDGQIVIICSVHQQSDGDYFLPSDLIKTNPQ